MSDGYLRLIPTDPGWQPTPAAADAAVAYVAGLFSGPGDDVEQVDHEFYERVTLIDAGEKTTRITCSRCEGDINPEWLYDLIEENGESFDNLDVTRAVSYPCGGLPAMGVLYDYFRAKDRAARDTLASINDAQLPELSARWGRIEELAWGGPLSDDQMLPVIGFAAWKPGRSGPGGNAAPFPWDECRTWTVKCEAWVRW